ncbi:4-hydroxybenzoate 3-monooxygenase [Fibrella aquatilis]|uniref:4-hydroxybenzoate 3-monooxygenase n=1 Tax=Fibrella aquatilis TaxID=2817059 RepID=A0A939G0K8_9BACT|nr:4-hydroxybenzoate 3-monooxygenase [Fibrella aquatilis]MBO0929734.1 4-hydroxybenzoate 3-monooxygenase [Fibrella aquatilis]
MDITTQVGIIGAGPAGLTLALLLAQQGIESVILENRSRDYVESRVRAGLLEQNTVDLLRDLGVADRLDREGLQHHGVYLSFNGVRRRVPFAELTGGRCITIYGQQEVVKDLIAKRLAQAGAIRFEAVATQIEGLDGHSPSVRFEQGGATHTLHCDYVAGCDGYHGISRAALPAGSYQEHRIDYPFSWLGILAHAAPASDELIYAYHERGFALLSLRSPTVSRLYLQVPNDERMDDWTDNRIWDELDLRLGDGTDFKLNRGAIFEKGITPMRSFMIDNMQYGRLFLAGDAAHIVPPTGGKGLNLAVADVQLMAAALIEAYQTGQTHRLNSYTTDCLRRVWRVQDFSNTMTYLFHKQAPHGSFENKLQQARFDYIVYSKAMATTIAENYVGLKTVYPADVVR